jgi:hypothetical protein
VRGRYEEDRLRLRDVAVPPLAEPPRELDFLLREDEPLLRDELLRADDERDELLRDEELPPRDDEPPLLREDEELRERDDVLRLRVERLPAGLRSFAGTSSRTTAPASVLS